MKLLFSSLAVLVMLRVTCSAPHGDGGELSTRGLLDQLQQRFKAQQADYNYDSEEMLALLQDNYAAAREPDAGGADGMPAEEEDYYANDDMAEEEKFKFGKTLKKAGKYAKKGYKIGKKGYKIGKKGYKTYNSITGGGAAVQSIHDMLALLQQEQPGEEENGMTLSDLLQQQITLAEEEGDGENGDMAEEEKFKFGKTLKKAGKYAKKGYKIGKKGYKIGKKGYKTYNSITGGGAAAQSIHDMLALLQQEQPREQQLSHSILALLQQEDEESGSEQEEEDENGMTLLELLQQKIALVEEDNVENDEMAEEEKFKFGKTLKKAGKYAKNGYKIGKKGYKIYNSVTGGGAAVQSIHDMLALLQQEQPKGQQSIYDMLALLQQEEEQPSEQEEEDENQPEEQQSIHDMLALLQQEGYVESQHQQPAGDKEALTRQLKWQMYEKLAQMRPGVLLLNGGPE